MIIYVYYVYMHILHTSSTSSYMTSGATQKLFMALAPSDLCDFFQVQDLTGLLAMLGHLATVRGLWATLIWVS